ncbi:phospholipase D-like domain-containing protein [Pseudomonas sp. P5_109]|uniref:phospholipase D-like domain-containing protein n=1 Tax=Pseudomonas sp. P5_109 TaxID=3043441 RepID=UPI002A365C96|nr:phospholipase D-like domain-containing protein [Pseudomonas sp. P5_109]WPN32697.1 phospholipase D-like domain-containing protein [Pseudomonas sp. P5_109]
MTDSATPYNGIRHKEISQINTAQGKALPAVNAPDFFIQDQSAFAPKRSGNDVRFFTTGEDYYKDLATEISNAKTSIFITGWQINYDVTLDGKQSLWQCLHAALVKAPTLKVFVMPWLSPAASVGTHDFETMLAVFQLNAGLGGARAFCTPAIQQSDMKGLGSTFSHHQKCVVIDNMIGYVGGIDLAYGRCDDNNFSLDARDRKGNDAYNPGIPHLGWMDMQHHVSRTGLLLGTLFDLSKPTAEMTVGTDTYNFKVALPRIDTVINMVATVQNFFASPPLPVFDWMAKGGNSLEEYVSAIDPLAKPKQYLLDTAIRQITALIKHNWTRLPIAEPLKGQVQVWIREVESSVGELRVALRLKSHELINKWMSSTDLGRMIAMFCDKGYDAMPADKLGWLSDIGQIATSLLGHFYALLQNRLENHREPFVYLKHKAQPLASSDYSRLADDQPRMPWQDVHSRIEGPSVYDLSRNFIDRWNGQQAYIAEIKSLEKTDVVIALMEWVNSLAKGAGLPHHLDANDRINLNLPMPKPVWIDQAPTLPTPPTTLTGKVSVQVLRSASATMTSQEAKGRGKAQVSLPLPPGFNAGGVQDNCLRAMLQTISSAQHFIYIENQFFQTDFGDEGELSEGKPLSGPMASLRDPSTLHQGYVARIKLREALEDQDFTKIDWKEVNAIGKEPGKEASEFLNGFLTIWQTNAQGWLTQKLGKEEKLGNPIGKALADRIGRAVVENRPFHVYLVLPVHPEGALNVLNLMHQIHLTMQSLVFGEQSLVKRIQRHMALKAMMDRGASREEAAKIIERFDINEKPVYAQQDWTKYLTLLNLRTWDTLGDRVVTEQIYIHSKLLIADDRVAILGSANINDRSLCGTRDSELAVIVRDSDSTDAKLDGTHNQKVGKTINKLRKDLWKKHFGMSQAKKNGPVAPFVVTEDFLNQPAAESTWQKIQEQAKNNSEAYEKTFDFIPQNFNSSQVIEASTISKYQDGFPAPVWPTWTYHSTLDREFGGQISAPLPYQLAFWESMTLAAVKKFSAPVGVEGFITAFPVNWTKGENNNSGLNLTIIAHNKDKKNDVRIASLSEPSHRAEHSS